MKRFTIKDIRHKFLPFTTAIGLFSLIIPAPSLAEEETKRTSTSEVLLDEIVVTARKRVEAAEDVPLSVNALGEEQIDALKIYNLTDLSVSLPNVAMDDLGTTKATANFSIRGLGVNSSIPSIDPTVGVFVDGVYMGLNSGILFDTFDLDNIQVLRGPQGILFGRNVTGGAVLINTKKPGDEFEAKVRTAIDGGGDGGLNRYLMGSVSGPLGDSVAAKITAYINDDQGWHENEFDGDDFGALEQTMFRSSLVWDFSDELEVVLRYERTETEGDGPAAQSHTNGYGLTAAYSFDRDSHDFSIDEKGFQDTETDFFSAEVNWQVGDGTVTNIFGYRDFEQDALSDLDSQPLNMFNGFIAMDAEQFSNELRYVGMINDNMYLTAGVYYFNNELGYAEGRHMLSFLHPDGVTPLLTQHGGGEYEVKTYGAFTALDFDLNDDLTLTVGARYTYEEKEVEIASLLLNQNAPCDVLAGTCLYDFVDDEDWNSFSPKLGLTYQYADDMLLYSHWTRGFRSGGYNLRNTAIDTVNLGPGPFDEETVDNYEFGFKYKYDRGRLNAALFYNEIRDMQREVNFADPVAGVVQVIKNTADADILGFELDGTFSLTDSLLLMSSIGWLDADYADVFFDLNGDGMIDGNDKDLSLPRAADLTYSLGLTHDLALGNWGFLTSRISYAYRDESAYTDNNRGFIDEQKILDAGLDFYSNDDWVVSLYGKNLLNEVKHGGDTQLPPMLGPVNLGGTFAPLAKGRVVGLSLTYSF